LLQTKQWWHCYKKVITLLQTKQWWHCYKQNSGDIVTKKWYHCYKKQWWHCYKQNSGDIVTNKRVVTLLQKNSGDIVTNKTVVTLLQKSGNIVTKNSGNIVTNKTVVTLLQTKQWWHFSKPNPGPQTWMWDTRYTDDSWPSLFNGSNLWGLYLKIQLLCWSVTWQPLCVCVCVCVCMSDGSGAAIQSLTCHTPCLLLIHTDYRWTQ
jgi:hypothetical protein